MAVTPENLIPKLAFTFYGAADEGDLKRLRTFLVELSREVRDDGREAPTRSAIYGWFNDTSPSRAPAHKFIEFAVDQFFEDNQGVTLSDDRRMVRSQIRRLCQKTLTNVNNRTIHGANDGSVIIKSQSIFDRQQFIEQFRYIEGNYIAFKPRLMEDTDSTISIEFVSIYRLKSHLYVDWNFLVDENRVEKYEGVLHFSGPWLWMDLYANHLEGRFRKMCFPRIGWGRKNPDMCTGIILTASPHHTLPRPTSCRVVLERVQDGTKKSGPLARHIHIDRFEHQHKEKIVNTLFDRDSGLGRLDAHPL